MAETLVIRVTTATDFPEVDALLARSYPALLKQDYPPSVMVTAVPLIARARPELLTSGTYFLADDQKGRAVAAGGWTKHARRPGIAEIRHVVTDPAYVRRGIGRALFGRIFESARREGVVGYECLATYTAVPFYTALGFVEGRPVAIPLRHGITFPAISMQRAQRP